MSLITNKYIYNRIQSFYFLIFYKVLSFFDQPTQIIHKTQKRISMLFYNIWSVLVFFSIMLTEIVNLSFNLQLFPVFSCINTSMILVPFWFYVSNDLPVCLLICLIFPRLRFESRRFSFEVRVGPVDLLFTGKVSAFDTRS